VSNFRIICVAALASPLLLIAGAAIAQSVTDQSGKPLAGLRPPHEHHKLAHAKTGPAKSQHNATAKVARKPAKRRSIVAASSTAEVPRRVAKNNSHIVNSRITNSPITWPSAEPAAAEESSTPQTALQFATEDTASNTAPATATATATTAKAKTVATDERKDPAAVDMRPTASKLVQTERFEAPAASQISSQAPTEMPNQAASPASSPAPTQTLIAAPARQEMTPASRASSTASILVTLAGAVTAGLVGWLTFGFGSARTIRVSREPLAPIRYLPFVPLR
jgi:hypothetical protein